jgi:AcrR family transcriptional regulator
MQQPITKTRYRWFMPRGTDVREKIIAATARLLVEGGLEAVTTRSVSAAANVQPPTIYRLFGDMRGLLDGVVQDGFERYFTEKRGLERTSDPLADLARGWHLHVGFGLSYPSQYRLMYGMAPSTRLDGVRAEADAILRGLVDAVATAGLLVVEPEEAARMIHSAGVGVTLQLIEEGVVDPLVPLSVGTREAVFSAITARQPIVSRDLARLAITLRATLNEGDPDLSPGEALLLDELLLRLSRP